MDEETFVNNLVMEGQKVPEVDAADLARAWKVFTECRQRAGGRTMAMSLGLFEKSCNEGANPFAIANRVMMLNLLHEAAHLIDRWMHDGTPAAAVFRVMAAIPMEGIGKGIRRGPPFDVEEFLRRVAKESEGNQEGGTPQS